MTHDTFDERVREAAQDYNRPPATPREEIWARIERARAADELGQRRTAQVRQRIRWALRAAAVLVIGIGIGRSLPRPDVGPPLAGPTAPAPSGTPQRMAAAQHLSRAEVLLTTVRSEAATGSLDQQTIVWARELLSTTRLLLDSRAAADPALRSLLQDLELVLAQIVQLPTDAASEALADKELDLVKDAIDGGTVLPRLRSATPAGTPVSTT